MRGRKFEKKVMDSKKKKIIIISVIFAIIILTAVGVLAYKILNSKNNQNEENKLESNEEQSGSIVVSLDNEKKFNIYSGTSRPIAVMIDNHKDAQPQGGLNNAYAVYEIIAEGGESRLMAVFKGVNVEKIGPVRSSRHYFLDYALENDAIYVHYGWSPQAQSDISTLKVNNINGISEGDKMFWRTKDKSAPHNVATSTDNILQIAKKKNYEIYSVSKSVFNYTDKEVILDNGQTANKINIPYSASNVAGFVYDEASKQYIRYSKGTRQKDWSTGEDVTTKNIIITFVENYPLNDGENKDRQTIKNIGKLNGYYITNGKAIPITCNKTSRTAKTIYEDLQGNKIEINDGRTFVELCPIDAKVTIE